MLYSGCDEQSHLLCNNKLPYCTLRNSDVLFSPFCKFVSFKFSSILSALDSNKTDLHGGLPRE
jgi:hypothetical protein